MSHSAWAPSLLARAATAAAFAVLFHGAVAMAAGEGRERLSIDDQWRFQKGDPAGNGPLLSYMVRPAPAGRGRAAPATGPQAPLRGIYPWILPTANPFIGDPAKHHTRPEGNPPGVGPAGENLPFVLSSFDDSSWKSLTLPHDWGIEGPFQQQGGDGATGRLPFSGVGWYRRHLEIPAGDAGKQLYLDVDGAMSYATVWLNGQLVGGWPYGYSSWRLDLTPYAKPGGDNLLAIRLDNPPASSRWYPGGGIYRNVWLTKTAPIHVAQWGTSIRTSDVSAASATVDLQVQLENNSKQDATVNVTTEIWPSDSDGHAVIFKGDVPPILETTNVRIPAGQTTVATSTSKLQALKLWSPKSPIRYVAVTHITRNGQVLDIYETPFGIRSLKFDPNEGLFINGEHLKLQGVCLHHDLGAIGTAFNTRAMERQLQILQSMGCNAIRTSHNPPAPELLDLCDKMGLLVMDEMFDAWVQAKRANDYHLLFPDWSEADARALVRRDRNHPSVIMWSIGNEIPEQRQSETGTAMARRLTQIVAEEDPTRPTTAACHDVNPTTNQFPTGLGIMGINYERPRLQPDIYALFHEKFPDKFVFGSETESTISSRGEYTFELPLPDSIEGAQTGNLGGGRNATAGENVERHQMSSYDLYHPNWANTPDKEFALQDKHKFLGGEFVWTGFDYLGEPTPWDNSWPSRSSYFGIIDLAGFPKDRFYLYQAHWRPDFPMAHILPHWNWPERVGQVTPVHVYTSGDEAELFLNGKSLGRKKKGQFEYRLRWNDVVYEPGELKVVAYKDGKEWATDTVRTAGEAAKLALAADRSQIAADAKDLSFITLKITDAQETLAPRAMNDIHWSIEGPGQIVATDNGDPTDVTPFASSERKAFNGLALAIVKATAPGTIKLTAKTNGLPEATVTLTSQ
jgi:beta-galactosidase